VQYINDVSPVKASIFSLLVFVLQVYVFKVLMCMLGLQKSYAHNPDVTDDLLLPCNISISATNWLWLS